MSKVYKTGFVVTGDASGGVKAMKATREEMDKLGETQKKSKAQWAEAAKAQRLATAAAASSDSQFNALNSTLKNTVGALAGIAGVSFTVQGLTQSISDAKSLRDAVNQVGTLLDDTSGMEAYRKNIVEMGKEWGDTGKQASALYNIVSAGHSGLTESARILEQANILAMGGVTDVFVATDGLTSALNAYNKTASSAADVSDSFFVAMKYGKTTIEELAGSIGTVAPIAATAGASFDELMAAAAAITSTGVSTSEAMVQLKGVMLELINPAEQSAKFAKEIGLEFNTAALKAKGLSGFLAELTEKTGGSEEAMGRLFGNSRALSGAMSLTGATADKFGSALDAMTKKAGASEVAMNKLAVGAEFALDMIAIKLDALKLEVGEGALDALEPSLIFINENFDELISTTAFLTKTTVGLFAAYKLGPPLMASVAQHTAAMSVATQTYTVRTLAATAATNAARLAMLALPHVAVAAGIATVVYAFTQYNNQQKETSRLANEARASIAAYNAEQNSVEGLQARLKAEEEALAAAQATAAAHEAGTSQAAQSLEKLRSMMDSGNFSGDTLVGLAQNYEKLQASIESATAKAEGSKQRIADLRDALAELGVQTADTAEKLGGIGKAGVQTSEQSEAIDKLTTALVDQYTKLALGERAYLDYQLVQQSATAAQREQALAAYDSIEALKAQANYASTLSKSASDSIKSLSDVEKQSQRVWSALAAGKISTAQAAAAIDGLAAAGAGLANEQQQWIDQMIAAMDPARALQEEITALQEAFEDGLFGDLSEDKFNDYIDGLKKKLAELNDVKIQAPAVKMGSAMQTAAGGIKDVAGAMQGMYSEGERGYQNMAVAMQAANVVAAVGAVLQQGMGDPYTAFARMASMAAAVAGLGYSVGSMGGGFEDTAAIRQSEQGTGTVLGDSSAKSESIANAIDITAAATSELVGINRGMLRALQGVQAGISGATTRIARGAGNVDFGEVYKPTNAFDSISGLGQKAFNVLPDLKILDTLSAGLFSGIFKGVGKLLGGSSSVTDEGIRLLGGTMSDMMDSVAVEAYQTVKSKKYRWNSSKTRENFEALDDDVGRQFALVFESLADSVYEGATALGFASDSVAEQINAFEIETQKISLKGLDAEEQQAEIEAVFSVMFDNLAQSTVEFLPKFQKAGEGLGETLARVATNVQVTEEAVLRLGFAAENSNPEQFAELSVYLIEASGDLEQFIGAMGSFVDKFAPETHKFDLLTADISRALADVGLAVPKTREEMWQLMQAMDATTESGADQIATLLRVSDTADAYYQMLESGTGSAAAAVQKLSQALQDFVRNTQNSTQSLKTQLMQLQGDTEGIRNATRASIRAALNDQVNPAKAQLSALKEQQAAAAGAGASKTAIEQQLAEAKKHAKAFAVDAQYARNVYSLGGKTVEVLGVRYTADQFAESVDYWNQKVADAEEALNTLGADSGTGADSGDFAGQIEKLQNEIKAAENASAAQLAAQEAIWKEEDRQAAAQIAAAIAQQRAQLQMQEMQLLGDLEAIRAAELTQIHESNQAIQQRIWALQDAQAAEQQAAAVAEKRFDLENQLLRLQGNEMAAVAREREKELTQVHESNQAIQQRIWALQDAQAAEQQAAAVAEKRFDLENQLLRLQGNELAAVAREREKELDALRQLSPELVELQKQIWAAHDAVQGDDGLDKYLQKVADFAQKELQRIEGDYQERIKLAEEQMRIGRELRQYVEQLRISELSPYDPGEKLELATEQFAALLVRAEAGDMEAARLLQSSAQAYLQNADSYYGRSDPYLTIFEEVTRSMDRLGLDIIGGLDDSTIERLNQQMLTEQQRIRDYAEQELRWAQDQAHTLTGIQGLLSNWPDQFKAMFDGFAGSVSQAIANAQPARPTGGGTGGGSGSGTGGGSGSGTGGGSGSGTGGIAAPPDEQRSFYDRAVEGGISHDVAKVWSGLPENTVKALDKVLTSGGRIPAFAKGGDHSGGIRLVGERGPELEVTGPSRIFNADDTRKILAGDNAKPQVIVQTDPALIAELQQLRAEVVQLRSEQSHFNAKAEQQRSDQRQATEAVVRATKSVVGVI